jgi:hypothetical protein
MLEGKGDPVDVGLVGHLTSMIPVKLRTWREATSILSTSCSVCTMAAPEISFYHSSETPSSAWGRPPLPCVLPRVFVCCEAQFMIPAAGLGVSFASSETRQNAGCYPLSTIDKSRRRLDDAGLTGTCVMPLLCAFQSRSRRPCERSVLKLTLLCRRRSGCFF